MEEALTVQLVDDFFDGFHDLQLVQSRLNDLIYGYGAYSLSCRRKLSWWY
jgi:hypothetical protein